MGVKKLEQMKQTTNTLSVYGYTEYRVYLKDFYEFKKDSHRGYSYRGFSKAAGFSSPNILKLVIDGQRNISPAATEKFIKALGFSNQMSDYFRTLVKFNQSKTDEDKDYFLSILKKLTPMAKRRELCSDSLKYVSHWLYAVISEMVSLDEFRDDPYWISRRIHGKATVTEISSALKFLISAGFISKDADGKYQPEDNMVLSSDEVKSLAVRKYHRQMLHQAEDALDNIPMEEREFGALTVVLPENASEELKYKIKQFRQELHTWAMQVSEDDGGEFVAQINMQMYPHTKKVS